MIVAIECADALGSVALRTPEGDEHEALLDGPTRQASQLLPALQGLLAAAHATLDQVDTIIVGEGPGSFTGVRVAAAAGLGLARAIGARVRWASSLAGALLGAPPGAFGRALASPPRSADPSAAPSRAAPVPTSGPAPAPMPADGRYAVLFDARGERLYVGSFAWQGRELTVTEPPRFAHLADIIGPDRPRFAGVTLLGAGADRHRVALSEAGLWLARPGCGGARARGLLAVHRWAPELTPLWREGDEPCYLRASSAEREAGRP